jgi:hypothetical protein
LNLISSTCNKSNQKGPINFVLKIMKSKISLIIYDLKFNLNKNSEIKEFKDIFYIISKYKLYNIVSFSLKKKNVRKKK